MTKKITQAEMDKRREITAQVDANNRLSGIGPLEEGSLGKELNEKWIRGEITLEQAMDLLKKHYGLK